MIHRLGNLINLLVLVSIPSIAEEDELFTCRLTGIEPAGVWLEGDTVLDKFHGDLRNRAVEQVFVPFAQIAFLTQAPAERPHPAEEREPRRKPDSKSRKPAR